uniref:Putative glycosyl transferase family 64 domain protein n=1 Tax=Nyssomyia neivai TaxID=330878 RepID=A0A1L8E1L1_9DIPT
MQAKKRYILVFVSCAFLAYCYFGGYRLKAPRGATEPSSLPSFTHLVAHQQDLDDLANAPTAQSTGGMYNNVDTHTGILSLHSNEDTKGDRKKPCRMETCFDFSRCYSDFLVYVYPPEPLNSLGAAPPISPNYQKIISAITESRYYTTDAEKACLFVLGIDTLDRDSLSEDYVRNVPSRLQRLPHWNNGRNHIIFNLYSGTWPDYAEYSLGFDPGEAILAKASMSIQQMRPDFDISIPLFHKQFPLRAGNSGFVVSNNFPANKKYLLAFKGKRYVHGIGSETRNSLFHLHNARDLVLVTTCRHGKSWRELQDARCDEDNREYDRYDYETLLQNSTFCLVPRGRRLGSFRFLEALQAGCIPVLLSNSWILPFQAKIDWNQAAIWADERLLLQVPDVIRSISASRILALRQQTQVLWDKYFSSIEKVVFTTFEIIRERIPDYPQRNGLAWNSAPGALLTLPTYSDSLRHMPFHMDIDDYQPGHNYTAIIFVQIGTSLTPNTALYRLVKSITRSLFVDGIIILWASDRPIPTRKRWPSMGHISLNIIQSNTNEERTSISQRFYPHHLIKTDAILSLDEDAILNTEELDFAYRVWRDFPDRIVGYPARAHYWDDGKNAWGYTSKWTNYYSIVLTGAAFYHRYYNYLYTNWLSLLLLKTVQQSSNCEDILMNFLISHVTRKPPIKVTQRKGYKDRESGRSPWNDPDHFIQRQSCLNTFAAVFGYMPLLRSNLRLDPVLYRDPVSNLRKKYHQIELVGS